MTKPVWTLEQIISQLDRWGAVWTPGSTVGYSFYLTLPTSDAGNSNYAGFNAFTATEQSAVALGFQTYSDIINLSFAEVPDDGACLNKIVYSNSDTMPSYVWGWSSVYEIWVNSQIDLSSFALGTYNFDALMHETGHSLGLPHPGDYNANGSSITYEADALYMQDSRQYTIMSYFSETNTGGDYLGYSPQTPMVDDIAALQALYGANMSTRTGDNVYGFNSNTGESVYDFNANTHPVMCIWDAGGNDAIDLSGYSTDCTLDLNQGAFSSFDGMTYNLSIAYSTVIENGIGGSGDDTITGNSTENVLTGNGGNDTLDGGEGTDTASYKSATSGVTVDLNITTAQAVGGGMGSDTLISIENLIGSAYDDTLAGNAGNNVVDGGAGSDTASYRDATSGVTVNLAIATAQTVGGGQGSDTLTSIENLIGSTFGDALTGNSGGNVLDGGAGNDTLNGAGGADTASYQDATSGVTVNLGITTAQAVGGGMGSDTLVSIENLIGSAFDDTLTGSSGTNVLDGSAGDDTLDGGAGTDTASYKSATGAVTVNLGIMMAQAVGGGMGSDTLISIENLTGSTFNDTLAGNSGNNVINGGAGTDTATYQDASSGVTVNLSVTAAQAVGGGMGSDTLVSIENLIGSAFNDTLTGGSGSNVFDGGAGDDTLNGGSGNDILDGGAGNDTLTGGTGSDTATYQDATSGVTVNLSITTAQAVGGGMGSDILASIENLTGSTFDDTLTGSSGNNVLDGGAGDDALSGDVGNDTLIGGAGGDTLNGGSGNNVLDGGSGNDILNGGAGSDTASYQDATSGVTVNLSLTTVQAVGGGMGFDTLTSIENLIGSDFDDWLTGNAATQELYGGAGYDILNMGAGLTAASHIDGGIGYDWLYLNGDYSAGLTLLGTTIQNVESINFFAGHSYNLTTNDANVSAGQYFQVYGHNLGSTDSLIFDGSHETDGNFTFSGGAGQNTLTGGAGSDSFYMYASFDASDVLDGGSGYDQLILTGDYSSGLTFLGTTIKNIELIDFNSGYNYNVTTDNANIASGQQLYVDSWGLNAGDSLVFDGSHEIDGTFYFECGAGNDVLTGGTGNDFFYNDTGGDDNVKGGGGDDDFSYGQLTSADKIDGGSGTDTLYLSGNYNAGVTFNSTTVINVEKLVTAAGHSYKLTTDDATVASGKTLTVDASALASSDALDFNGSAETNGKFAITGGAGNDTLRGGAGNDTLKGGAGDDSLNGGTGDDLLNGCAGNDTLYGSSGSDTVSYKDATGGVTVSLGITTAQDVGGGMGSDKLSSIENLTGSSYGDTLTGNSGSNLISGGSGNDTLSSGGGGTDTLLGGSGNDTINFTTDLRSTDVIDGGSGTDTVNLDGDYASLTFAATTMVNVEKITLAAGHSYKLATDDATVAAGKTLTVDGSALAASDTLTFTGSAETNGRFVVLGGSGNDTLKGGAGDDSLNGGTGDDLLNGCAGNDTLYGSSGSDTVSYKDATGGVTVSLGITTAQDVGGGMGSDKLSSIENLTGSNYGDTLTGNTGSNLLSGGSGNDTLSSGGGGTDTLLGGSGNDTINFTTDLRSTDAIDGGSGTDTVNLDGNYTGLTFAATTMVNVEKITLAAGHSYKLTTNDATVAAGKTLTVDGSTLGLGEVLTFNGSAETDGSFIIIGGADGDSLTGGSGADTFVYKSAAASTSTHYDTISGFDFSKDSFDIPGGSGTITAIDTKLSTGSLSTTSFDSDLTAALTGILGAHHAMLFTPDGGTLSGKTFLVVDTNGTAGYQAGQDLVIRLTNNSGVLAAGGFH